MDDKKRFVIESEKAIIGNKLTLKILKRSRVFIKWMIVDTNNGENGFSDINEPLYGFYRPNSIVELRLIDNANKKVTFKNVEIIEKKAGE